MNNKYMISVVIPTHNRCELLESAINSVLNQTYNNFELIIIDDASKDSTEKYIKCLNFDNLIYIKNNYSVGGSEARNIGIRRSKGRFIAFLDDDDEWLPNKLKKQIELFKNDSELGLVYTGVRLNFLDLGISYDSIPKVKGFIYNKILIKNWIGITPAVMVKRDALDYSGLFDANIPARQDYDLWIRISKKWKIDYISEPLVISYNRNNLNRISSDVNNYVKAIEIINKKYKEDINKLSVKEKSIRKAQQYFFLGSQTVKINNNKLAREYFVKSFCINPSLKSLISIITSFFGCRRLILARKLFGKINRNRKNING